MSTVAQSPLVTFRRAWALGAAAAALWVTCPAVSAAQGVMIHGATTLRYVELRPYVDDSVAFATTTPGAVDYRQLADGRVVRCVEGDAYCRFKRGGTVASSLPMLQDLRMTAWGLGRGLSAHADVRIRSAIGSEPTIWPRGKDSFDALAAYVQLERPKYTVRGGRQYAVSGLGVYNFDGATLSLRPSKKLMLEGFGGWSLAQALNESVNTSEIATVDELPPDRNAYIVGMQVRVRPSDRGAFNALYQREVRVNRSALYGERVAVDGTWHISGIDLEGALTRDLSAAVTNEFRVRLRTPPVGQTTFSIEARRFRPFFELWTIWGAFAPVGFDEARLQASWRNRGQTLAIDLHAAKRDWQDTDAGLSFQPLRASGWRVGSALTWRVAQSLYANAGYSADVGFGSSRSEGDAGVHWDKGAVVLGVSASTFQSIYEFRVGTTRVFGIGADAGWRLTPDVRLVTEGMIYQQQAQNNAPAGDWNQRRATMRFEWTVGTDPGTRTVSAAARKAAARERATEQLTRLAASSRSGQVPASAGSPEPRP